MPGKYWVCRECEAVNGEGQALPRETGVWRVCFDCHAEQPVSESDIREAPGPRFTLDPHERECLRFVGNTIASEARFNLPTIKAYTLDAEDVEYVEERVQLLGLDMTDPEVRNAVLDEVQVACNRWLARQRDLTPRR